MTELPHRYRALDAFAAPARARSELWRTFLGAVFAVDAYLGITLLAFEVLRAAVSPLISDALIDAFTAGRTATGMTLLLFSFLGLVAGVVVALRLLHRRSVLTLVGPFRPAAADFFRVTIAVTALALVLMPLSVGSDQVGRHLTLGQFFAWLPLAIPGLLVQTGAEELAFRGYLQQQLGARYRSPVMWLLLPSVLFGALHYAPDVYGPGAIWIALWAVLFGCLAADLTARTGNLGAAIGLHFANNFSAICLVGVYGDMDGLALYNVVVNLNDFSAVAPLLVVDFAWIVVVWLLARLVLRV